MATMIDPAPSTRSGVVLIQPTWLRQGSVQYEQGLAIGDNAIGYHRDATGLEVRFAATASFGLYTLEILPGLRFLEVFDTTEGMAEHPVHPAEIAGLYATHGATFVDLFERAVNLTGCSAPGGPPLRPVVAAVGAALASDAA